MSDYYEVECAKLYLTLKRDGIQGLNDHVTDDLEKWKSLKIKVAVTGNSGAGKSSLINALRGLKQSDENAAKEGTTETTTERTCYTFPNNDQIEIYDLPGVGTLSKPIKTYMEDMNFKQYDFVMIVSSERFLENNQMIIEELHRLQKPFYFVKSKVGADVDNQKETQTRDEVLDTIRESCLSNLQKTGVKAKDVFLIDSHVRNDFDLGKLQTSLVRDAPDALKISLMLTFRNTTKEVLTEKVKVLKRRVRLVSIKATLSAVPGAKYFIDLDVVKNEVSFYKQQLGLDDNTLGDTCNVLEVDIEKLKQMISYDFIDSFDDKLKQFSISSEGVRVKEREMKNLLDCLQGILSDFIQTYSNVHNGLCEILDKLEKVALEVSEHVLEKIRGSTFL